MLGTARDSRIHRERILAAEGRLAEAGCEVLLLECGVVLRQREFPHVFDANLVRHPRLEAVDLDAQLAALEAPLREVGARHLQIAVAPGGLPDAVATELRRRSFYRDRLLAMALTGRPSRQMATGVSVRAVPHEVPFSSYAEVMDRMSREEPWYTPALSREIVGSLAAKADAGVLALHVAMLDGRPAGGAGLATFGDGVAAITTVGTIPSARRRGVAQSLVVDLADKARVAGCDLVYLVARADDTPRDMYRKLGFEVVYAFDVWLRPPI